MSKGLIPGATLPDFELPDDGGTMHRLSELQGDDAMVLMLGRGEHCPRERQHQRSMVEFHGWSTGAFWPYLCDEDLEVQKTLDIAEYTDPHHDATVPHTIVLAPGLVIDKVYVGYWFWGRPSPQQLWADLQDLL